MNAPQAFFDAVNAEFGFALDVCASASNRKTSSYSGLDHPEPSRRDGLLADWAADAAGGAVWANVPYGRASTRGWPRLPRPRLPG